MPTVAELDVQINAKDDASATILALDALLKDLDGDDVSIDIDANAADVRAQIAALLEQMRRLDQSDPDIDIDTRGVGAAEAELARLQAEINALRDATVSVRVNDQDVRRARGNMNEFRNSAIQASRSMNAVLAAVLGLGAALVPIGAVAVGGMMALVSMAAVGGVALAGFGAVAFTVFSGVRKALKELKSAQEDFNKATTDEERNAALEKTKAIMDGLDPATRGMVTSIQAFKKAWRDFAMEFQPQVFELAQTGLEGMVSLLPSLKPIIAGTSGALLSLEKAAIRALQGPFWQSFLTMIGSNAAPLLNQFGRSIGNIIKGFAALIMAFMPMTRDFSGGMLEMTASFAKWAEGLRNDKGFQNFVDYIYENTPLVLGLIASITLAFVAVVKAAAPLGEALVIVADAMFDAMVAFQQAHPTAAAIGIVFVAILGVMLKLAGPLLVIGRLFFVLGSALTVVAGSIGTLAATLGIMTGTLLAIIAVVAAVVAGFIYAYTHFEGFRNVVNSVASAIAGFAVAAYQAIVGWLGQAAAWLSTTFAPVIATVMDFVRSQFDKIRAWIDENGPAFREAWQNIATFLTTLMGLIVLSIQTSLAIITAIWNAVWPVLLATLKIIWDLIKGVVSGALDIIMGAITMWTGLLAGDWSTFWDGVVMVLRGAWTIIASVVKAALAILHGIIDAGMNAALAVIKGTWNLILAGFRSAGSTMLSIMTAAWSAIRAGWTGFVNGVQNTINAFLSAAVAAFRVMGSLILAGLRSAFSTMVSLVTSSMSAFGRAVSNGISSAVDTITTGVSSMVSAVTGIAGRFYSAGASLMSNLAQGIRDGIGNAVGAVRGAVSSLTDLLPGSPAKVGPLSGEGYSLIRGQHFSEDLAEGIASRSGLITSAARDIADLMSLQYDSAGAFNAITAGAAPARGAAGGVTITIAPGAVEVKVGDGASLADAKEAFAGAGDELATSLLTAIRRQ